MPRLQTIENFHSRSMEFVRVGSSTKCKGLLRKQFEPATDTVEKEGGNKRDDPNV